VNSRCTIPESEIRGNGSWLNAVNRRGDLVSLWDMLSNWGLVYLMVGINLATIEITLERYRSAAAGIAPNPYPHFDPNCRDAEFIITLCNQILSLIDGAKRDLETVPANVKALRDKIRSAQQPHIAGFLEVRALIEDARKVRNDFHTVLETRFYYYLRPDLKDMWGVPELFGSSVAKKFRAAANDIEHAGNCLALGESTACVLHLVRAMEAAVRELGKRLKITINPKDTWGMILNNMDQAIQNLPEKTEQQKRKKSQWAECRVNLYHVKMAWRDDSMHGKVTYDERQAREILERVRAFMQQLATL
jgi:hypothetical protein